MSPIKKASPRRHAAHIGDIRERGAELVQLALCLPVLLIVFASCVQVSVIGICALSVAGASSVGIRSLDVDYLSSLDTASKNAYVKKMIANVGTNLASDISVSDTSVGYNNKERYTYLDSAESGFSTVASSTSDAYVTCTVSYKVPCFINLRAFRDIEMTRIVRESVRTDVSAGVM